MNIREQIKTDLMELAAKVLSKFEKTEVSFNDAKLVDGTIVTYDGDLVVGNILYVVDEAGQKLPAPMGEHVLEDGTKIEIVDNMGTIGEVTMPEDKPTEEVEPVAPTEQAQAQSPSAPSQTPKSIVESVVKETRFKSQEEAELELEIIENKLKEKEQMESEYKSKFEEMETKFASQEKENAETKGMLKQMYAMIEKLGDEPSVVPAEPSKNVFKSKADAKQLREEFRNQLYK
jgi:hypothetical protein